MARTFNLLAATAATALFALTTAQSPPNPVNLTLYHVNQANYTGKVVAVDLLKVTARVGSPPPPPPLLGLLTGA